MSSRGLSYIEGVILVISISQLFMFGVQIPIQPIIAQEQVKSVNAPVNWTIMVYMAADNDLESAGIEDLTELKIANFDNTSISVIVEFDGWESCGSQDEDDSSYAISNRYYIPGNNQPLVLLETSEKNMGNPDCLRGFIDFSMENYPANYYCLILWNHGLAWETGITDWQDYLSNPPVRSNPLKSMSEGILERKNLCWDDRSFGDSISETELRNALEGLHLDIIAFDACLMGSIEIAYGIKEFASYMISSEDSIGLSGFYYTGFLESLQNALDLAQDTSPGAFASIIAQESFDRQYSVGEIGEIPEIAVIDLTQITQISTQVGNLVPYITSMTFNERHLLCENVELIAEFGMPEQIDLAALANLVVGIDSSASTVASNLISTINNAVIWEDHIIAYVPSSHGLTIYFPWREDLVLSNYGQVTRFGSLTTWSNVLSAISSTTVTIEYYDPYFLSPSDSTASGYLYEGYSDIYNVWLYHNERASFSLTGSVGSDFDMYLYDYEGEFVAESIETTYPELISCKNGGESNWAYLEIYSYSGSGSYDLTSTFNSVDAELDILGCIDLFPSFNSFGINEIKTILFFDCPAQTVSFTLSVLDESIPFDLSWDQSFERGYQTAVISIPCNYLYHFLSNEDPLYTYSSDNWDCFGKITVIASYGGSFSYSVPLHLPYMVKLADLDPNLANSVNIMESYPSISVDPYGGDPDPQTTTASTTTAYTYVRNNYDGQFFSDLIPVFYGVGVIVTIGLVIWRKRSLRKARGKKFVPQQARFQYQSPQTPPQPRVSSPQAPFIFCRNCGNIAMRSGFGIYICTKCGQKYRVS